MAQFDLDCLMAKLTGREPTCYENGLEMIFFSITRYKLVGSLIIPIKFIILLSMSPKSVSSKVFRNTFI